MLFFLLSFFIQFISSSVMPFLTFFLVKNGINMEPNLVLFSVQLAIISFVVGTVLAWIVAKRVLKPISDLNDATKKIAKGEFDVHIEEMGIGKELCEMTKSFNIMVEELKNTETFSASRLPMLITEMPPVRL